MSKFSIRFKRFIFSILSIMVPLVSLYFSVCIISKFSRYSSALAFIIETILLFILILAVFLFTSLMMSSSKFSIFLQGIVSLIIDRNNKYVYHEELGYFLISFRDDKIYGYKQGFMYIEQIFDLYNDGDPRQVAKVIKKNLDTIYYSKLAKEKEENDIKSRIDKMKNWDGYLDTRGRRDGKLNDILGK